MERTEGSLTSYNENYQREDFLFTYSEEEKQKNEINSNNANLVLNPKFIPLYPATLEKLNLLEGVLYGFIEFFLSNNDKFYCSNEQLANLLRLSESSIKRSIQSLQDKGYIKCKYKIKAGGGKTRFINLQNQEMTFPKGQIDPSERSNGPDIYNNIIKDITGARVRKKKTEYLKGADDIRELFDEDEIPQRKYQLKILLKMVELGFKVEKSKDKVLEFINWLKSKADLYNIRKPDGSIAWVTFCQKIDKWYDWHIEKNKKVKNFRTSIIPFISK